ncbi:MAG: hypothetical protein ACFFDN_13065 [Candidatus Hodarchaeota archaeon]
MENENDLDPHSFIVLETLNAFNQRPIKQRVIFQKIIFLTLMNFEKLFRAADFKAHLLGPYSSSIEKTTEQLIKIGEVKINEDNQFEITNMGIVLLERLRSSVGEIEELKHIQEFEKSLDYIKKIFIDFTTDEMLAFIYKSYPDFIESSIRADELDYENIFIELYKKGKLSVSKIAELMDISLEDAYEKIKEKVKPAILP